VPVVTDHLFYRLRCNCGLHADETGTAVETTNHWAHTLTTKLVTLVAVHPKQSLEALTGAAATTLHVQAEPSW
jgi:hypothetical protein